MADQTLALGTKFTADISEFLRNVKEIREQIGKLNSAMIASGKQLKARTKETNAYTGSVNKATRAMERHARSHSFMGKQISKTEKGLKRLRAAFAVVAAYGIAGGVVGGILLGLREGTSEIVNFDQALKNLQAITGATKTEIAGMDEEIRKVARTTKFSTTEVADGMVLLGQAGLSAEEAMSAIQATSDLATGTITDFKETADLLTTTLRAFGLNASESTRISDVMANAINRSKLTIDKLRTAFNYVGASAAQSGLSLEQTAAAAMTLANSGLRASTIGTGLRQVLARLLAPSSKLREAFKEHGIELDKVNPSIVGFEEAVKNLVPTMWDTETGTVDMGKAVELFGLRGAQAAAVLIKGFTSGEYQRMLDNVYRVGTAGEMAATQVEGLALKFKNVADRARLVAVALGDAGLTAALHAFASSLQTLLDLMEKFIRSSSGQFITQAGLISTAILALGGAFRFLAGSAMIGSLISKFSKTRDSMGMVIKTGLRLSTVLKGLGIGAAVIALGSLIAAYFRLQSQTERLVKSKQKEALQHKQNITLLRGFEETLRDLDPSTRAYEANVRRLAAAYKGLGTETELLNMRQDELLEKIKRHEWEQMRLSLESNLAALDAIGEKVEQKIESMSSKIYAHRTLVKDIVRQDTIDRVSGLTREMDALNEQHREQIKNTEFYKKKVKEIEEILQAYSETLKRSVGSELLVREQAELWFDQLEKRGGIIAEVAKMLREEFLKALEDIENRGANSLAATLKEMEAMGEEFEALYDSLNEIQKLDFVKKYATLTKEMARTEKEMSRMGKSQAEIEKALALMKVNWLETFDAAGLIKLTDLQRTFLNMQARFTGDGTAQARAQHAARLKDIESFIRKAKLKYTGYTEEMAQIREWERILIRLNDEKLALDIEEINRKRVAKRLEIEKWYLSERAKLTTDEVAQANERFKAEEARLRVEYEKRKATLVAQQKDTAELQRDYDKLRELNAKNRIVALARIKMNEGEKLLDLEEAKNKALMEERKRQAAEDESQLEEIKDQERQIEIEHAEKVLKLREDFAKKVRKSGAQDKDAIIAADKAVYQARANLSKLRAADYMADRKRETSIEVTELKARLKYVEKYSQEYYDIINRLNELGAAADAQALAEAERQRAKQEGLWASFQYGLEQARAQVKDWGDIMIQIGSQIEDTIAGNMTDAILDFAEGTKTAKEAFEDFARSTVRWLAQIILKQTILNALRGYTSGGGGYGTTTYTGGEMGYTHHRGGIVGRDGGRRMVDPAVFQFAPRLHKGLRADEFPAILQRGEEVIPKTQTGKPFGDVKVIVNNNSGQQVQASPEAVKWDGSNMIVSVVIDAYQRNKMGLRDMMRSPA
jgi:TP901 family phage tail tape measure protein